MTELWEITQQNPWWDDPKKIENDPKVSKFNASSLKYLPEAYGQLAFDKEAIYVVKGVRQIGKSTLLKLTIKRLIDSGLDPRAIFFFSFDNVSDHRQIPSLIKQYLDLTSSLKLKRHFIFFDEITFVKDWQKGIKYAADIGLLRDSVVLLTGSSAVDLKYSAERLPGRRGGGDELNKLLLPISFREFLKFRGVEIEPISLGNVLSGELTGLEKFKMELPGLQNHFMQYARVGGIPAVMDHFVKTSNAEDPELGSIYTDVFFSTMGKLGKNRTTLLQMVRRIMQLNFSRFSWQSFTSEIDVGSFHTTLEYLEHMADSYFTGILYFLDHSKKVTKPKKEKKVMICDPMFFRVFASLSGVSFNEYFVRPDQMGLYIENIVYSHLLRFFKAAAFEGLSDLQNISLWYSDRQKEVDFLIYDKGSLMPVELKYQSRISPSDYVVLKKVFNKGIVLTREHFFTDEKVTGIPVAVFLAGIV